jgi:hypothetical protein
MERYVLKHYMRDNSHSSVAKLHAEWAILAHNDGAAISLAATQLVAVGFQLPDHFAILWNGPKIVWERIADA